MTDKVQQVVNRIYSCRQMQEEDFKNEIEAEVEKLYIENFNYRTTLLAIYTLTKDKRIKDLIEKSTNKSYT